MWNLRIESAASLNGFIVHVQDSRKEPRTAYQQAVQCTFESAKQYAVLRAQDYLKSFGEAGGHVADWRCAWSAGLSLKSCVGPALG
jgi:hypothetical protein